MRLRLVLSMLLSVLVLCGLGWMISETLKPDLREDPPPERIAVDFVDPDQACQVRRVKSLELERVIKAGRICANDDVCTLLSECSDLALTSDSVALTLALQRELGGLNAYGNCGPVARPSCVRLANPAGVCEQGECVRRDLGLPPGVH